MNIPNIEENFKDFCMVYIQELQRVITNIENHPDDNYLIKTEELLIDFKASLNMFLTLYQHYTHCYDVIQTLICNGILSYAPADSSDYYIS